MNTIEINESLVLQYRNGVDDPVVIKQYTHLHYRHEKFKVIEIQMLIQIFHTELKHFDLRKATLIDPDERRPIFSFKFDSVEKQIAFMLKRLPHIMGFQQLDLIEVDGEIVVGAAYTAGSDLYRLRSFMAWLEHMTGQIESNYLADCEVIQLEGGSMLSVPDITIDDLVACLKEERPLVRKVSDIDVTTSEGTTIDGITLKTDQLLNHMSQIAILERMETCTAN